jgi:hypothetical protein
MSQAAATLDQAMLESLQHLYPPSWIDRFTRWTEYLPIPAWLFYLLVWVALFGIETLIQWNSGSYPPGTFHTFHIIFTGALPYLVMMIHYLDRNAGEALDHFRPALDLTDSQFVEVRYWMTTMPQRQTLLVGLGGVIFGIIYVFTRPVAVIAGLYGFALTPASTAFNILLGLVTLNIHMIVLYHTYRQVQLIERIYTHYARVNLLQQLPLYTLSGFAGRTAVAWVILAYSWFATVPGILSVPLSAAMGLLMLGTALVSAVWPLRGIHRLLMVEKEHLLAECSRRLKISIADLHQRIDDGRLEKMDNLNKAMLSLEIEHAAIKRIPTWPWQPETLRIVIAAFLFPLSIWLLQSVLSRVFSP